MTDNQKAAGAAWFITLLIVFFILFSGHPTNTLSGSPRPTELPRPYLVQTQEAPHVDMPTR